MAALNGSFFFIRQRQNRKIIYAIKRTDLTSHPFFCLSQNDRHVLFSGINTTTMQTSISHDTDLTLCFSSMLPDAVFETSAQWVRIALYPGILSSTTALTNAQNIFDVTLYPYNGEVTLRGVRDSVEQNIVSRGITVSDFTYVVWDSTSASDNDCLFYSFPVLYCIYATAVKVSDFTAEHMLTTRHRYLMPRSGRVRFACYNAPEDPVKWTFVCRSSDGNVSVKNADETQIYKGFGSYNYSVPSLALMAGVSQDELLAATVNIGSRVLSWFFTDAEPRLTFRFRNAFNAWERCDLWCVTTEKPTAERSFAPIGGKSVAYDEQFSKQYEVQTAPLPAEEAGWLEQLIFSREVMLSNTGDTSESRVFITDSTIEPHDNDSETVTAKFTWRFAENRPCLNGIPGIVSDGIFTTQFNHVFQ